MPQHERHLAELILALRFRGKRDSLHTGRGAFSPDILATNAILHNPKVSKLRKIAAYREWLATQQPCAFGKAAAGKKHVFVCLIDEKQVLAMKDGDADIRDTIQDHRKVWKRRALHGLSSSFVILLLSETLATATPCLEVKEVCRRLMELYLECRVNDDEILQQREYVYLSKETVDGARSLLKFGTLPNIFCAQADKRWWHDHRTPGAIMITSNALGHFLHTRAGKGAPDTTYGLKMALLTIQNAHGGSGKLKDITATRLTPRPESEPSPFAQDKTFGQYSARRYAGRFHTDHLLPSCFFTSDVPQYRPDDLDFSYIHDTSDPDHQELVAGRQATWYEIRDEIWIRQGHNLQHDITFSQEDRRASYVWLESRLNARCK